MSLEKVVGSQTTDSNPQIWKFGFCAFSRFDYFWAMRHRHSGNRMNIEWNRVNGGIRNNWERGVKV